MQITKKSNPKAWAIIKKALPNYSKRSASLHVYDDVELTGRYWDEGSLTEWQILVGGGQVQSVGNRRDFPFQAQNTKVDLTGGKMAVSSGYFCGKVSTAALWVAVDPDAKPVEDKAKDRQAMVDDYYSRNEADHVAKKQKRQAEITKKIAELQKEFAGIATELL